MYQKNNRFITDLVSTVVVGSKQKTSLSHFLLKKIQNQIPKTSLPKCCNETDSTIDTCPNVVSWQS